jgi:heat shock protein HslJ
MRREQTSLFLMAFFLLIAMACTPIMSPSGEAGGTVPAGTVPGLATVTTPVADATGGTMEELTLYIAPERVACTGVAPMQCLQVKFDPAAAYELFYEGIDGFVYVPGYNYELRVQRLERENPPADASKYVYSLIEVVAQTPAYAGEALPLEGPVWQLIAFGAEDRVIYQPEVAVITATFADGQLTGSAGCNNYGGEYTTDGNTLLLSPVIATRMACLDEGVMVAENAYFTALASAGDYAIEGNLLTITYAAGQLTFLAADPATTD